MVYGAVTDSFSSSNLGQVLIPITTKIRNHLLVYNLSVIINQIAVISGMMKGNTFFQAPWESFLGSYIGEAELMWTYVLNSFLYLRICIVDFIKSTINKGD